MIDTEFAFCCRVRSPSSVVLNPRRLAYNSHYIYPQFYFFLKPRLNFTIFKCLAIFMTFS